MIYYKALIFILISIVFSNSISAQIVGPIDNEPIGGVPGYLCNRTLNTEATGDTGPFDVTVLNEDGSIRNEYILGGTFENQRILYNVCPGQYTVRYVSRYGCDFTEVITITSCGEANCCDEFTVVGRSQIGDCVNGNCNSSIEVATRSQFAIGNGWTSNNSVEDRLMHPSPQFSELTAQASPRFSWSNGESGSSINELCSGNYTVTATNLEGCVDVATFTVCCISVDVSEILPSTHYANIGSFTLEVESDVEIDQITYGENNLIVLTDDTATVTGLAAGEYTISVTTTIGCKKEINITIPNCSQPPTVSHDYVTNYNPDGMSTPCTYGGNVHYPLEIDSRVSRYVWEDGYEGMQRFDLCYPVDTRVYIYSPIDAVCPKHIIEVGDCFFIYEKQLGGWTRNLQYNDISLELGATSIELEPINVAGREIIDIRNMGIPVAFHLSADKRILTIDDSFEKGRYSLDIIHSISGEHGCPNGHIKFNVIPCSDVSELTADIELRNAPFNSGGQVRLKTVLSGANVGLLLSSLTFDLIKGNSTIAPSNTTGVFYPRRAGMYSVKISSTCGIELMTSTVEIGDCQFGRVHFNTRDICGTRFGTRTWFQVAGFSAPRNAGHNVGDQLKLIGFYNSQFDDGFSFQKDVTIVSSRIDSEIPENLFYGVSDGSSSDGNERFHIKNGDLPGFVEAWFTSESGCVYRNRIRFGVSPFRFPIIGHPRASAHTDQLLIARPEFSNFVGPYYFGAMDCEACNTNSLTDSQIAKLTTMNENLCRNSGNPALFDTYSFVPNDIDNPCTGGGVVMTSAFSTNNVGHTISPSAESILFEDGPTCGCLFPAHTRADFPPLPQANGLPLYVEFQKRPFNGGGPGRPHDFDQAEIDALCARFPDCSECDVRKDGCKYDLVCVSESNRILIPDVHALLGSNDIDECFVITDSGPEGAGPYVIWVGIPCATNPCSGVEFTPTSNAFGNGVPLTSEEYITFVTTTTFQKCTTLVDCDFDSDPNWLVEVQEAAEKNKIAYSPPAKQSVEVQIFPNPVTNCDDLIIKSLARL